MEKEPFNVRRARYIVENHPDVAQEIADLYKSATRSADSIAKFMNKKTGYISRGDGKLFIPQECVFHIAKHYGAKERTPQEKSIIAANEKKRNNQFRTRSDVL